MRCKQLDTPPRDVWCLKSASKFFPQYSIKANVVEEYREIIVFSRTLSKLHLPQKTMFGKVILFVHMMLYKHKQVSSRKLHLQL